MIIDATQRLEEHRNLRAFDAETGEEIRYVTRIDSDRGEVTVLKRDERGGIIYDEERDEIATETARRPFRVVNIVTREIICEAL